MQIRLLQIEFLFHNKCENYIIQTLWLQLCDKTISPQKATEDIMASSQMNDLIAASGHAEKKAARLSLGMYLVYFLVLVAVALLLR